VTEEEIELSPEEKQEIYDYLNKADSAPMPEEKHTVHTFLYRIATAPDTTKVGFLDAEELGKPRHPLRAYKEFALLSKEVIDNPYLANIFAQHAEILTSTSLSREGFLVKQGTTQTRQISDITRKRSQNKSWFKKKDEGSEQLQT